MRLKLYDWPMTAKPRVLVAGSAGFIGSNLLKHLILKNTTVLGIDNFSEYYSVKMKNLRQAQLGNSSNSKVVDIRDRGALKEVFAEFHPNIVINLAAQGGVRASRTNPLPYLETNQIGFFNLLDISHQDGVEKFIFASSSSVYGDSLSAPFSEYDTLPTPKSLYALSKVSNELIAQHFPSTGMRITGLRFFTVYGPWGRPDMAMFRIIASSLLDLEFQLSASPDVVRDFTFVDDVSNVIENLISEKSAQEKFQIFNVAGGKPYSLTELFEIIRSQDLNLNVRPTDPDSLDVKMTHGSIRKLEENGIPVPSTSLHDGVQKTIQWFRGMNLDDLKEWFEYSRNV